MSLTGCRFCFMILFMVFKWSSEMYTIQNLVGYYFSGRNKNYPWTTVESNAQTFETEEEAKAFAKSQRIKEAIIVKANKLG